MSAASVPTTKRGAFTCEVLSAKPEEVARNTYRIFLKKPEGFDDFYPGQNIKALVRDAQGDIVERKSFSMVSAPHEPFLEFVFRVPEERARWSDTKKMLMALGTEEGCKATLETLGAMRDHSDEVIYTPDTPKEVPIVMLAGGVGIAPFVSMMRYAEHIGDARDFHLLYANPTYSDVAYEDEIDRFSTDSKVNLTVRKFLTRESREGFEEGYFTPEHIQAVTKKYPTTPIFFISGSEGMVEDTVQLLTSIGISEDTHIRVKLFSGYTGKDDTIRE